MKKFCHLPLLLPYYTYVHHIYLFTYQVNGNPE